MVCQQSKLNCCNSGNIGAFANVNFLFTLPLIYLQGHT